MPQRRHKMEDIKEIIAKNISDLRAESGMTQLELAERLHYSDKAVSKWERGESVPEISTLVAISKLFSVSLDYLVTGEHTEAAPAEATERSAQKQRSRGAITAISVFGVWFAAVLYFVLAETFFASTGAHWLAFIYAIPACAVVWLVLNTIWFSKRRNYLIISIIAWGAILSAYLTLLSFSMNIWMLFILGVPAEIVIILCSLIRSGKQ